MSNKQTVGELVYKISGDGKDLQAELKKTEKSVVDLESSMKKADKSTNTFGESLKNLAKGLGLLYLANLVISFGKSSVQAFANAQQSLIQFNNAQQNVAGSTKEQIDDLNDYINALEAKTTVDDKSIRQASQILAQDQIKIENQKKLLNGIVDIAVANSKANGGEVDVSGTAVAVGRAIATGDLGGLTRQNIVGVDETTAKLFKAGDQATRTAIAFKLLAENGADAGEKLGNSFQGSMNRAKDTVEDLQVAIGKGLSVALTVFTGGLSDTVGGLKIASDGSSKLGTVFTALAGFINLIINEFKLLGIIILSTGNGFFQFSKILGSFILDALGAFNKLRSAILNIGTAMTYVLKGDFSKATESLKDSLDFTGTFDNTKKALDSAVESAGKLGDAYSKTEKDINSNLTTIFNAKKVYTDTANAQDKLAEATDAVKKATEKQKVVTEEAKKEMEALKNKVFELRQKTDELSVSLGEKLVEAVNKFKESSNEIVKEGAKSLVDIVVNAERDIADLRKQLADEQSKSQDKQSAESIKKLQDEIAEKQKILTSQADFQNVLTKQIADTQKQVDDATLAGTTETDPAKKARLDAVVQGNQLQLEALKGFSDLDKQIADARKLAGEDEFKQAQINIFGKLELTKNAFIDETSKLREKQAIAIDVENQITSFYKSQTAIRQKTLDTFATNAIAQLRKVGEEARSAMAALDQARSRGIQIDSPIIPISTPTTSGGISTSNQTTTSTSNTKNVNAPITVNATINDGTDPVIVAKELQWQLSKTN